MHKLKSLLKDYPDPLNTVVQPLLQANLLATHGEKFPSIQYKHEDFRLAIAPNIAAAVMHKRY
ncbi:MAG TPA: hypothetical protein V6C63_06485 [Allocoleopsis sp.]